MVASTSAVGYHKIRTVEILERRIADFVPMEV